MKITLTSTDRKITGDFKSSGVLFLVWDEKGHSFIPHPDPTQHCIAAFCRQNSDVVAIKMHSSLAFADPEGMSRWLKTGDNVHLGIESFMFEHKKDLVTKRTMKIVVCALVSLISVIAVMGAVAQFKTRPVVGGIAERQVKEDPAAAKLLSDAKLFIANGDALQAKMSLEQLLNIDPTNEEARALVQGLDGPKEDIPKSADDPAKFLELSERADIILKSAVDAESAKDMLKAYKLFIECEDVFKDREKNRPDFWNKVVDGKVRVQKEIESGYEPMLSKAKVLISSNKTSEIKQAVVSLKDVLSEYPGYEQASLMLKEAFGALDRSGMQYVMKAETLRRLSGCKDALPQYKLAIEAAAYPEVPAYQRAEVGMGQCQ